MQSDAESRPVIDRLRAEGAPRGLAAAGSVCPCCAGVDSEVLYTVRGYHYVACAACGSARLDPMPEFDPTELFGEGYFVGGDDRGGYVDYDRDADLHRRNARSRLRFAAPWIRPGRRADVIDVGCASGYTLDAYRSHAFVPHGVDVSPWARAAAAQRGHDVHARLTDAITACDDLRAVSFFQSLEHLPDPDGAVAEAAGALSTGGALIVETWDLGSLVARAFGARWQQANPPSVLHLFTRAGLSALSTRHGLEVTTMRATSKVVSPALVAGVVAHQYPRAGGSLLRGLELAHLSRVAVPYRLGDLISLVAIKR